MKDDVVRHTGKARRAYRTVCLVGLLGSVCECSTAYAGPLDLDQTFKGTGEVVTDFQLGGAPGDYGNGVGIDQTGKIIVIGSATNGNKKSDFALARYLSDGNPDNTFGIDNNTRGHGLRCHG